MRQPTRLQLLTAHLLQRLHQRHPEIAAEAAQDPNFAFGVVHKAQGLALSLFPEQHQHLAYTQVWAFDEDTAISRYLVSFLEQSGALPLEILVAELRNQSTAYGWDGGEISSERVERILKAGDFAQNERGLWDLAPIEAHFENEWKPAFSR